LSFLPIILKIKSTQRDSEACLAQSCLSHTFWLTYQKLATTG
jgi:hypothetical protein